MTVNLLDEQTKDVTIAPQKPGPLLMHQPGKEIPPKPVKPKKNHFLTFIIIFAIIIAGAIASYFYFFYQPPVIVVNNVNVNLPPTPEPTPEPTEIVPTPEPTEILPSPEPTILPSPTVWPDTELAPLRGAVIKFSGDDTLYLIENNGELRWIDRRTVVFENGQSINEINSSLVYTLSDRWKYIRRGSNVYGLVDWDPRVLGPGELAPFL